MPDDRATSSLYDQDLDAWALRQAAALRAVRGAMLNSEDQAGELLRMIDWDNLAEEIEGLVRKDRREFASRVVLVVEHLVKLEFSPAHAPRAGWIETVEREREEIAEILRDSPSLYRDIPDILAHRADAAIKRATDALSRHGETVEADAATRRRAGPGYRPDEVLGTWIPGAPAG